MQADSISTHPMERNTSQYRQSQSEYSLQLYHSDPPDHAIDDHQYSIWMSESKGDDWVHQRRISASRDTWKMYQVVVA